MTATTALVDVDLLELSYTGVAGANGIIQIITDPVPSPNFWKVERIVVACTSTAATLFELYKGNAVAANLRARTINGNSNIAEGATPLRVSSSRTLLGIWTGADPGSTATLVIEGLLSLRVNIGVNTLA